MSEEPSNQDHAKLYAPAVAKHPLRFSFDGDEEKIAELKAIVNASELHAGLKAYIADEFDRLGSNAAAIHLKDVEQPSGGCDLHISIRPKHHGKRKLVQGAAVAG
jgi:hypothetical protein